MTMQPEYHGDVAETYEELIEHPDRDTQGFAVFLDRTIKHIGHVVMIANLLLIAAIVSQVVMRYALNLNFPKLDELQWHFYGLVTMFGVSYALVTDSHVRVDLLHMQLSRRAQRVIEMFGILFLLAPFIYLMIDQGYDYFYESFRVDEGSSSATGLPNLWIFKSVLPISFVLLGLAAIARLLHDAHALLQNRPEEREGKSILLVASVFAATMAIAWALKFTVETTWTTKSRFDDRRSVGSSHDDNLGSWLQSVHKGQQLRDNSLLNFASSLFTLWSDGINFINKDNGSIVVFSIGFRILKGTSQVGFTLSSPLGDDFWTVDDKEISSSLSCHCPSHRSLSATRRPGQ